MIDYNKEEWSVYRTLTESYRPFETDYQNGLVSYTSRDYNSLVREFWDLVPKLTDLWRPEADADPGVVLGKYIASVLAAV